MLELHLPSRILINVLVSAMTNPTISVVIPFYNAERTLRQCVSSAFAQDFQPFEVILVDNNSTDGSSLIAREFVAERGGNCFYVAEPRQGPSPARNTGTGFAKGEIIAFIDSDCVPHERWLWNIMKAFNNPSIGAVAGRIVGARAVNSVETFHALFTLKGGRQEKVYKSFSLNTGGFATANLAVRKLLFENLGGFDESRSFGEDHDLCARIYRSGHSIKYTPSAVVFHHHRSDVLRTCRQAFHFGESHPFLLSKHFEKYLLLELGGVSLRATRFPIRAWINLSSADKKVLAIFLLSMLFPPFLALLPVYYGFLFHRAGVMAKSECINISRKNRLLVPLLLVAKSASMTAGRLRGSCEHHVLCL